MKRSLMIAIAILIALFGMQYAERDALALDAPHNTNNQSWSITCSRCHYSGGALPIWMTLPTTTDNTLKNNLCKDCHSAAGMPAADPRYTDIRTHSAAETGSTDWGGNWTVECSVCHSPHIQPQAQNAAFNNEAGVNMVTGAVAAVSSLPSSTISSLTVSGPTLSVNAYVGGLLVPNTVYPTRLYRVRSNTANTIFVDGAINQNYARPGNTYSLRYGKMVNSTLQYPGKPGINPAVYGQVKFFNAIGPNSFATGTSAATAGICQVCHTQTISFKNDGTLEAGTHPANVAGIQNCTECHAHGQGFKGGGCNGCHGNPPVDPATLVLSPATGQTTAGAHAAHVIAQGITCDKCHDNGMPESAIDTSKTLQIGFNVPFNPTYYKRVEPLVNGYTYSVGNPNTTLAVAPTASQRMGCTNLYCHSNVQNNDGTAGPSSYATVTWTMTSAHVQCGNCHNADGVQGTKSLMSTGSHTKHLSTAAGFPASACNDCHAGNNHGDGLIDVIGSYSQGTTHTPGSGGYGNCNAAVCHDNGRLTLVPTPDWGVDAPKCTVCHAAKPGTGSHTKHLASTAGAVCADCHNGYIESASVNQTNHLNALIEVYTTAPGDLGYPVGKTKGGSFVSCSTASCHDDGLNNLVVTPVWGTANNDCSACHARKPATGSHLAHLVSTQATLAVCGDCHNGAVEATTKSTQHLDTNIDVYKTTPGDLGYPLNKTKNTAFAQCSNIYCHSSGQGYSATSATPYTYGSPTWGNAASGACGTCHPVLQPITSTTISSGSHTAHLSTSAGAVCGDCHSGAGTGVSYSSTNHVNTFIDVLNSYTAGTIRGNGYGTCSTAACHDNGFGAPVSTPAWGVKVGDCSACHQDLPSTGSHLKHLVSTLSAQAICSDCHKGADNEARIPSTEHLDTNIDVYKTTPGDLGYPLNKTKNTAFTRCSNIYCHSSGQGSTSLSAVPYTYGTPTWGNAASGACGTCHPVSVGGGLTTGGHPAHLNTAGAICGSCHTGAGTGATYNSVLHVNRQINVRPVSYTAGTTPGNGYGTCNTSACHGTVSPNWGVSTTNAQCTKCHGNPTAPGSYALYKAAPGADGAGVDTAGLSAPTTTKVGAHSVHLITTAYHLPFACTECHKVPSGVNDSGHIDSLLPAEITSAFATLANLNGAVPSYNVGTATCSNVYCHDGQFTKNGATWSNGTGTIPKWNNTAYLNSTPTVTADCNKCHGYPPAGGHPADANCVLCHSHVASTNIGFKAVGSPGIELHVNGLLEGGGDACLDCHGSLLSIAGSHSKHTSTTLLVSRSLTSGDYGVGAWWFSYSTTGGAPVASCGYCHPSSEATHKNGAKNLSFAATDANTNYIGTMKEKSALTQSFTQTPGTSVVCGSVYCHSNGYTSGGLNSYGYRNTPDWYGGVYAGDKCAGCHTNSPTGSSAHAIHAVGIHYDDIYTGTVGTMLSGATGTSSHGNAATSTTINCNVCHSMTVASGSFNNDRSSLCTTCHNGAQATLRGNMVVAPTSTRHVDGTPDVAFAAIQVRSKAQVRNDITTVPELNTAWTRSGGYKASGSVDIAKSALSSTNWSSGTKNCTVVCHNYNSATWTNPSAVTCNACHTALP